MNQVLGIDPSSKKIAMIYKSNTHNDAWSANVSKYQTREEIAYHFFVISCEWFKQVKEEFGEDTQVWIEEPVVGRNKRAVIVQAQIQGVLMASALHSGLRNTYSVSNTAWKKEVVGMGNADKEACKTWLQTYDANLATLCGDDPDFIDAACIAIYGRRIRAKAEQIAP